MLNNPLANALSKIMNAERLGRSSCTVKPVSKVIMQTLKIMQDNKFIGEIKETEKRKGGAVRIELLGKINKCGVIRPPYSSKKDGFERFEQKYLPAKGFGILIVSTPYGIMTQENALKKESGGVLLAYCY
ncbi:30S ribosomal protein S8 [Candidatus Woesearchaeota archaeon]|nr:30S ribosomal protein S8 [Candidatus Woesearchaeota archaeon]